MRCAVAIVSVRAVLLCVACLLSTPAHAERELLPLGWEEAVLSVSDIDAMTRFFEATGDFRVVYSGALSRSRLDYWGVAAEASATETVLAAGSESRGRIRLIDFHGVPRTQIRDSGQSWDTGGWFDLMFRTHDAQKVYELAQSQHWQAYSQPVEITLSGGARRFRLVILKGPDGINLGLYERVQPPLTDWPSFELLSAPFNAMQIVNDLEASLAFYRDLLGMEVISRGVYQEEREGPTNFGLPHNYGPLMPRDTAILHPVSGERGRVELVQWMTARGNDYSARAVAPNLGILSLRFQVPSARALAERARTPGPGEVTVPAPLDVPEFGVVECIRLASPDGALSEFCAPAGSGAATD